VVGKVLIGAIISGTFQGVPLPDAAKRSLHRFQSAASTRAAELRRFASMADLSEFGAARAYSRRFGISPIVYPDARAANLDMLPPWVEPQAGLVVDLGANEGEWTASVLRVFPEVEILAVEPGWDPLGVLQPRFAHQPNVTIVPHAVAAAAGTATFHRTESSVFASLLPPRTSLTELYPESPVAVTETVEVPTSSLDELVGDRPVSVLKLDVQGGELAVLAGGARTLEQTAAVLLEVLFQPHYEGDAGFAPLHEAMVALGFELFDLSEPDRVGHGPALWADASYVRPVTR
jgi:FkbM family methyltransferase